MGTYAQVRGWFEVDEQLLPLLVAVIEDIPLRAVKQNVSADSVSLYQEGWHVGNAINNTRYVFFGADIRAYYLDFYREIFKEIAELTCFSEDADYEIIPDGVFYVDSEDDYANHYIWKIGNGRLSESIR
jgi:hypothetical protein